MKSCCFMSLKRGSYFSAGFTLIFYTIVLCAATIHIHVVMDIKVLLGLTIALAVMSVFTIMTSILLIIGLKGDNKNLLIPWIITATLTTIIDVAITIYLLIDAQNDPFYFCTVFVDFGICTLNTYCLICVICQYKEYRASEKRKRTFHLNGDMDGLDRIRSLKPETSDMISTAKSSRVDASIPKAHVQVIPLNDRLQHLEQLDDNNVRCGDKTITVQRMSEISINSDQLLSVGLN